MEDSSTFTLAEIDRAHNRNLDFKKAQDYNYNGEDWTPDEALQDGPMAEDQRSCTDILCSLIFIAYFVGMGYIGYWAFTKGDMERLTAPVDDDGHFCGVDEGYEDYPFVYWPDLTDKISILSNYVCVKECPQYENGDSYECVPTLDWTRCESKVSYNSFKYLG